MRILRIAGATVNQTPIHWAENINNILQGIEKAKREGADIICFPELTLTGYGCEDLFLSDWLTQTAWEKLSGLMDFTDDITVCVGLPVKISPHTYNGMAVIRNRKLEGVALKQNLPGDGIHYEPRWFSAWQSQSVVRLNTIYGEVPAGDLIFDCKGISFGFEICEDAWRVNRPGQLLCKRGVELILNPSASHFAFGKNLIRESIVCNSSANFNCTFLMVNQLGNEAGKVIYDGDILLASKGKLLLRNQRLSFHPVKVQVSEIDFDELIEIEPEPDLFNAKNEAFAQAAALALFDYLRKSRARGFTLSLSGGADSACCAILVSEMVRRASDELGWKSFWTALGENSVITTKQLEAVGYLLNCAYQGTQNSSQTTFQAAAALAGSIGAKFYHWSVEDQVNGYREIIESATGRKLDWQTDDITLQNIQARSRSPVIWMLANMTRSVLLTTSNRSEGDVGYATMDGDTSGSLAPIAGVDKPFIIQWLKWTEIQLGYRGLYEVNSLKPSAELRPQDQTQTDEQDLMPYNILLAIERQAILHRKSPRQVFEILKSDYENKEYLITCIVKFYRLWSLNQWKRERLAPSFHFDDLNVDPRSWCRFPILSGNFSEELEELRRNSG
jgi:NAD+ synthase (glutamine-hydrolysing)